MDTRTAKILARFKRQVVFYGQYKFAFSQIENAIENTEILGEPLCALLYGVSGSGKSTLCRYCEKYHSSDPVVRRDDGTYVQLPIFYCEVPAPTTVRGLIGNMFSTLIGQEPKGTVVKLTHQLITCLHTAGVKVIFLDEIQLLCVTTISQKVKLDTLNWIVTLLNKSGIPVILSGTELCRDIRNSLDTFAKRYPYVAELSNFRYEEHSDSDYFTVLKQLDSAMYSIAGIDKGVHLYDRSIAAAIFVATAGNFKTMRLIMSDALKSCLQRDGPCELNLADFHIACECISLRDRLADENPFALELTTNLKTINDYQEKVNE
ncbi:ATP-binding protein [Pseudomonas pudica]|uniref:TniB family NTP-binding protein n=1 Tax=Pseudomonas pudica TaxID=272772 RepID=A0ABS0FUM8_9PSED|nr:ATP-binding protein [Pseudomonas pudica]MBF8644071.1 TniB family NTP-binding protein [Pseudomonas pudica]MBF8758562.1 TniB family NTP-binding protein [Pseudomonas pudica]